MPSGVMSTRDKMLASAGLVEEVFKDDDCPEGVDGVPGVVFRAGLAAKTTVKRNFVK